MTRFYLTIISLCLYGTLMRAADGHVMRGDTVTLNSVTVHGTRIVNRPDGLVIYPTRSQKETATSGYALLRSMALPELRIDETARTVTSLNNRGTVQVRINGVLAGTEELQMLDCRAVERIEYTDRPGVRYGEDTGYVVNIVVRRATRGHTVGVNLANGLTAARGNDGIFGRVNSGKSQWEAAYNFGYAAGEGNRTEQTAVYTMPNGTAAGISTADTGSRMRSFNHRAMLTYSRADSGRYVLQAKAETGITNQPRNWQQWQATTWDGTGGERNYVAERDKEEHSLTPLVDVYCRMELDSCRSFTANAVATGFITDYRYHDNDDGPYGYEVRGRSWSLTGEAIYESRLRPFTLSTGLRYKLKRIDNTYTGNVSTRNRAMRQTVYAFGQLNGTVLGTGYVAGLGVSRETLDQPEYGFHYTLLRPKMSLSRPITRHLKLSYDFSMSQHVSTIANANAVTLRRNAFETERGNPGLRPTRVTEHTLKLSYMMPRLSAYAQMYCKLNDHPNMMRYLRETDDDGHTTFIYTQSNQPGCDMLMWMLYAQCAIIPERLDLTAYGQLFRFINTGDDYRHLHTSFTGGMMLTAYLGHFTVTAYADLGFDWMEGEMRGRQSPFSVLSTQYRLGNVSLALRWQQPLRSRVRESEGDIASRYVSKELSVFNRDNANLLMLSLTWTLSHGRRYQDIDRTMNNADRDAGIMK